jgi:quercetin dioxygenase-like cupin family protein
MVANPEYNPSGVGDCIDTNILPWIAVPNAPGMSIKPARASGESGIFSLIFKLDAGSSLPASVYLGGMDMLILSGKAEYTQEGSKSVLNPGTWGFVCANSRVNSFLALEETEVLANFYSAVAFLNEDGALDSLLTALDVLQMAKEHKIMLVPNSLQACLELEGEQYTGAAEPLAIASGAAGKLVNDNIDIASNVEVTHPHFVDTRQVPWLVLPGMEDVGLKILRVSQETGYISLIVRHNGVAHPHTHIGASDFLVLQGQLGVRAGPPEGYGPGIWFYEPAGARHDATQRVTTEDLIYTANLYGPIIFDSGPGTQIESRVCWVE